MCDCQSRLLTGSLAEWAAAASSLIAAVVSLYLGRRGERQRLRVFCNFVVMPALLSETGEETPVVYTEVTNVGVLPVTLKFLYWQTFPSAGGRGPWPECPNERSSRLPCTLAHGESASWEMTVADFRTIAGRGVRAHFRGRRGWLRIWVVRFGVLTSTGTRATTRLQHSFRRQLREMAQEG